jgi:hypothetical protein
MYAKQDGSIPFSQINQPFVFNPNFVSRSINNGPIAPEPPQKLKGDRSTLETAVKN